MNWVSMVGKLMHIANSTCFQTIEKDINLGDTLSTDKDMTVVEGIDEALGGTNDDEMIEGGEATEPEVQPEPEPEGVIERTPEKYAEEEHGAEPEPPAAMNPFGGGPPEPAAAMANPFGDSPPNPFVQAPAPASSNPF